MTKLLRQVSSGQPRFNLDASYASVMSFKNKILDVGGTAGATAIQIGTNVAAEMRGQMLIKTPDMPRDNPFAEQRSLTDANVLPVWAIYIARNMHSGRFEPSASTLPTSKVGAYEHCSDA